MPKQIIDDLKEKGWEVEEKEPIRLTALELKYVIKAKKNNESWVGTTEHRLTEKEQKELYG